MVLREILPLIVSAGLALSQSISPAAPRVAPVPADRFELVSGSVQSADTPASRRAALQLLARARANYALQTATRAYDLKVSFTADSGGQTNYDGSWQMEDMFDPQRGLRWTASAAAGYTTAQISLKQVSYREGTANILPLRLQEARAALFSPMPSGNLAQGSIRTSAASFNGVPVTCILLSEMGIAGAAPGRRWEETEECIDPQSGLLQVHSQVPGRYYAYDYSNALQFEGHVLPRKVIVAEAGRTVSEIHVESLADLRADTSMFVPTEKMKAGGTPVAMAGARKVVRFAGDVPPAPGSALRPVCVFGLVTPSGQLVEAHSLQPSDPNSQAAVAAAMRMNFSEPAPAGQRPRQHFVFVIEEFASSQ